MEAVKSILAEWVAENVTEVCNMTESIEPVAIRAGHVIPKRIVANQLQESE